MKNALGMGKGKKRTVRLAACALAAFFAVSGCGSSDGSYSMATADYAAQAPMENAMASGAYNGYDTGALYDSAVAEEAAWDEDAEYERKSADGAEEPQQAPQDTSRKLITTMHISAETEEMDALLVHIESRVAALGGYIEASDVSNGSYRVYNDRTRRYRSASMTIRIPADNLSGFVSDVQEHTNITNQSKNIEDVTLTYTDLESHRRMLKTEEDRLLRFMEQAETIEDMIAVESRLTEVQYQLDSMESQLRTYDNRINYSTVYLSIEEVIEYTVTEEPETVWEEIAAGFTESLRSVGEGLRNFFVWFVTHIPQLVIWAIVLFLAVKAGLAIRKRSLKRRAQRSADGTGEPFSAREQRRLSKQAAKREKREAKARERAMRKGQMPPQAPAPGELRSDTDAPQSGQMEDGGFVQRNDRRSPQDGQG